MLSSRLSRMAFLALGIIGLLASSQTAKAEYFEYTSKLAISTANGSYDPTNATITNAPGNKSATFDTGSNSVILSAFDSDPSAPHYNGSIGTNITPLTVAATTGSTNQNVDFNFSLDLTITNYTSLNAPSAGQSGTISFTGRMSGNLGNGAVSMNLLSFATVPQTITIDNEKYTISLAGYSSPTLDQGGSLSLSVKSEPVIPINPVPEPASIALVLMGVAGAVGIQRRRSSAKA